MLHILPSGWREVRLEDVCERVTVGHVGPMANEYVEAGVPFLRSQNVQPFHIDASDIRYITDAFDAKLRKSALRPGDVVVVRTGYPGTAAVIPDHMASANCADLVVITPSSELDPWFLTCIFNSVWGKNTVAGNLVGVAQQHFNVGAAKAMKIGLPPLPTQQRIAAILSAYDDLIENNTRRIAILEEMARRLYEEWFVHFRFPGHEAVEFDGDLPRGWRLVTLADVASVNPEAIKPKSAPERIRYIDIASVSPGRIDAVQELPLSAAPGRARRIVRDGDVIWSCVRPNRRSFALVVDPANDTVASTGFAVLRAVTVPFSYLYCATSADAFVDYLTNHATGAAYPAVKQSDFERAELTAPAATLLSAFDQTVHPMLRLAHALHRKNANLRAQRDLLLPKLVSGEIDVSAAEEQLEAAG